MPVLRINQQPGGAPNQYRIEVTASGIPGLAALSFSGDIAFELTPQDGERVRWYLEDYLQFDEDPAPQIAHGIEAFMADRGEALFRSIFEGSAQSGRLWSSIEPHLPSTRIEITTGIAEATAIPWELIRNPHTRTYLALSAESFVRTQREAQTTLTPAGEADKVRILLVICRPRGGADVPFRSVAGRLVTRLSDEARGAFDIDVLRPPTYEQLATTLRLAKDHGQPYHIVHFDGHGVYADAESLASTGKVVNSVTLKGEGAGPRGFLAFEDPASKENSQFVDGLRLGALLRDASVPVLVLNACQSAFAEAPAKPKEASTETRDEVEAYGSLAQAVMEAGAAGVVAMRYSVYVVTAAQFVAELYGALARGRRLGEAVTSARKNLSDQPNRQIAYEARPLQDWSVPVVWEREPLRLWAERRAAALPKIHLDESAASKPGALDQALPARPDIGFFGRDETLYALDRAFDTHRIVLLHAYAGSGKTSTAAEFARWYVQTGGVEGPALFSSFERHLPLARVLDKIGAVFGDDLEASDIHWDAIVDPGKRRDIALQVLKQVPVLWIWDNVEPITGFPAGTASDWSTTEQQELRAFLSAARDTKAKFLLTSRRDEQAWLGDLTRRASVPPMPMQERLQLAGAVVAQRGKRLVDLPDLTPLLRFTRGNPLTILVTVGEALRAGIDATEQLDAFVEALRAGEVTFEDEASEGRSKSLGASLSYGFGKAFDEDERRILALLHMFQGFLDERALPLMGVSAAPWCLEAVRGLTPDRARELLDRAVDIGLLNAEGAGCFSIHPALPWYFRALFERHFPQFNNDDGRARRAFVGAMGELGNFHHNTYDNGDHQALPFLAAEEDNLLSAWRLARANGWWGEVTSTMQGLRTLYDATGRRPAWRRLVESVLPDFVDSSTDGPLAGREEGWSFVTAYRIRLTRADRNWEKAERLLRVRAAWDLERARPILEMERKTWTERQRNIVRNVGVSQHELAQILREQGKADCADAYQQSLAIDKALGDLAGQAVTSFNLGHAYLRIPSLRDLDQAEHWYRQSLELSEDALSRGQCFAQLGVVAFERFIDAFDNKRPNEELAHHLREAAQLVEEGLEMTPQSALLERGTKHAQLDQIYGFSDNLNRSLQHYRQCVRAFDEVGNLFGSGQTRLRIAAQLFDAGQFHDARAYAVGALANFHTFGDRAADGIKSAEKLIVEIDQAIVRVGRE